MTQKNKGFDRIVKACGYSLAGIKAAWKGEAAFRQECLLMLLMLPMAFWLGRTVVEEMLLIAVCVMVLVVELINSAIEAVVDRIGSEHHLLAGRAKDMGSAAVFVSVALVIFVWLGVACDRLF